jgi:hypothetical protein
MSWSRLLSTAQLNQALMPSTAPMVSITGLRQRLEFFGNIHQASMHTLVEVHNSAYARKPTSSLYPERWGRVGSCRPDHVIRVICARTQSALCHVAADGPTAPAKGSTL